MIGLDVTHRAILGPPVEERLRTAGRIGTFVSELNVFFSRYHAATYGWTERRSTTRSQLRT